MFGAFSSSSSSSFMYFYFLFIYLPDLKSSCVYWEPLHDPI